MCCACRGPLGSRPQCLMQSLEAPATGPTSASWLNLVERFFAEITTKRIRRGAFASVAELKEAIYDYLLRHNANPKPFVWTKAADAILDSERRALDVLDAIEGRNQALDSQH